MPTPDLRTQLQGQVTQNGRKVQFTSSTYADGTFKVEGLISEMSEADGAFGTSDLKMPPDAGDMESGEVTIKRPSLYELASTAVSKLLTGHSKDGNDCSNKIGADGYLISHSDGIQVNIVKPPTDGLEFKFTGPGNKIDKLGARIGGGTLLFVVETGNDKNLLRVSPPANKSITQVAWKKEPTGVTVLCK